MELILEASLSLSLTHSFFFLLSLYLLSFLLYLSPFSSHDESHLALPTKWCWSGWGRPTQQGSRGACRVLGLHSTTKNILCENFRSEIWFFAKLLSDFLFFNLSESVLQVFWVDRSEAVHFRLW
jgi:hypothetical protein